VIVNVRARSPRADLNGTGLSELQVPLSLTMGVKTFEVSLKAPSGRTVHHAISGLASRAIANGCHLTQEAQLSCDYQLNHAGVFVSVGDHCGLTAAGEVWCLEYGAWMRRYDDIADIIDLAPPCVLTRSGAAICAETDGGLTTQTGHWSALECRTGACCGLGSEGAVSCWGSHEYNLFDRFNPSPLPTYPYPRAVYGFPGQYVRLTSGYKTFFGGTEAGEWTAASNRMGFPGDAPFVISEASATTLKLDSPYYCIMGLEADGGAWVRQYGHTPKTPVVAGASTFIDFTAAPINSWIWDFRLLTSEHELVDYKCP